MITGADMQMFRGMKLGQCGAMRDTELLNRTLQID